MLPGSRRAGTGATSPPAPAADPRTTPPAARPIDQAPIPAPALDGEFIAAQRVRAATAPDGAFDRAPQRPRSSRFVDPEPTLANPLEARLALTFGANTADNLLAPDPRGLLIDVRV